MIKVLCAVAFVISLFAVVNPTLAEVATNAQPATPTDEPPDSTNEALQDMLQGFLEEETATELAYDSWTVDIHRYLGIGIVAASLVQAGLGIATYNKQKNGEETGTADVHQALGYTIVGMSLANTTLGYVNFWKMRNRETGKKKRWAHLTLSTLATAGFVTAAVLARNAREDLEKGDTAGKTFDDLYGDHRTIGFLSAGSVVLTAIVILW